MPDDYGDADMHILVKHFGTPKMGSKGMSPRKIDPQATMAEWPVFRTRLLNARAAAPKRGEQGYDTRLEDVYEEIFRQLVYPNMLILAAIFLVLCLSSVW